MRSAGSGRRAWVEKFVESGEHIGGLVAIEELDFEMGKGKDSVVEANRRRSEVAATPLACELLDGCARLVCGLLTCCDGRYEQLLQSRT